MKHIEVFHVIFLHLIIYVQFSNQEIQFLTHEKCSLSDSVCLTTQAQNSVKAFVEGNTALGIQKLDKISLGTVNVEHNSYNWTDVMVDGMKNAIIDNVSIDMDLKTMRILFHSDITIEGHHVADGLFVNTIHVFGDGTGQVKLENMLVEILFLFDVAKDDARKDIIDLKNYFYGLAPIGGVKYKFVNLFNGDEKMSYIVHKILNENWRTMIALYGPYFNKKITDKIFDAIKIYLRSRPLEDIAIY